MLSQISVSNAAQKRARGRGARETSRQPAGGVETEVYEGVCQLAGRHEEEEGK